MGVVLGLESSCDDTAVALLSVDGALLSHASYSQTSSHAPFGGVVPELAARDHLTYLFPLLDHVFDEASITLKEVDMVAYTAGPGLIGPLLMGGSVGYALGRVLGKPVVPVHHLVAHVHVATLSHPGLVPPYLACLVSGGHTMLLKVLGLNHCDVLGETLDDAAGEAFDKTAKVLGLPFPGGPALAKLAESGDPCAFALPRPMCQRPGLDMSFSGLKTAVIQAWQGSSQNDLDRANLAASFQAAVVDVLCTKVLRAVKATGLQQVVLAGGVSANQSLRTTLGEALAASGAELACCPLPHCTDNAIMVAYTGACQAMAGMPAAEAFEVRARWPLATLATAEQATGTLS